MYLLSRFSPTYCNFIYHFLHTYGSNTSITSFICHFSYKVNSNAPSQLDCMWFLTNIRLITTSQPICMLFLSYNEVYNILIDYEGYK